MVLAGARMPATGEHRGPFGLSTWKPPPSRDEWGLLRSKPPVPGCLLHLVSSTWLPLVAHSCRFLFSSLWSRELNYLHLLWILKYLACFLLSYSVSGFMFLHILCLVFLHLHILCPAVCFCIFLFSWPLTGWLFFIPAFLTIILDFSLYFILSRFS